MLQGTSSHVGKSVLAAALCRIFYRAGYKVAPFKAQNMANNSYVTADGGEMGRAQVVQAWAAGIKPRVEMNPVLLKPTGHSCSQVIVMGRPVGNLGAKEYHKEFALSLLDTVARAYATLAAEFEIIVIEGAGSPAEINLKDQEIANMRIAKMVGAPVLLVTDIDRGGALASVVGTLELLEPEERDLVAGIIINKFRGDLSLLKPALDFLEKRTGKPVLGVIPYLPGPSLPEEDSVALEERQRNTKDPGTGELDIAIVLLPRISNFTDFDALEREPGVRVRYVEVSKPLGRPDLVILPGSKNTIEDLLLLKQYGRDKEIIALARQGTPVVGICGGFQMLGKLIRDPFMVESSTPEVEGLGLLPMITTFKLQKATYLVEAEVAGLGPLWGLTACGTLKGYEIHMGISEKCGDVIPAFYIRSRGGEAVEIQDGAVSIEGHIWGTYIHGIFDNDGFRQSFIEKLRQRRGLRPGEGYRRGFEAEQEKRLEELARTVASHLDLEKLGQIMGLERPLVGGWFAR
ncbi:adenosylcobyric acid synthase (glutamine-hydrolysing) [Thermanaeromonas toyohensis ToBE]|uniref:Cobyric acid synthase n=1 Tax=Thermanaeromonas toyohensis ToBE TaxID=698762 RepID=A0A1W1VWS8_9FIRM|nr:cobyric acid synthase [Thermanaeromonas toyohensis]SMB97344.1 adenosylcobyric acid synthase (glutamine-hydrolysing) [Thermanaeromonas toyohensis ToBE]